MANKIKGTFGIIDIIDEYTVQKKTLSKKNNSRIDSEIFFSNKISELLVKYSIKLNIPNIYDSGLIGGKKFFIMDRIYPPAGKKNITTFIFWRFEDTEYQQNWDTLKIDQILSKELIFDISYNLGKLFCALINHNIAPWEMELIYGSKHNNNDTIFCIDFDKWGFISDDNKFKCNIKAFKDLDLYKLLIQECFPSPHDRKYWHFFIKGMLDFIKDRNLNQNENNLLFNQKDILFLQSNVFKDYHLILNNTVNKKIS